MTATTHPTRPALLSAERHSTGLCECRFAGGGSRSKGDMRPKRITAEEIGRDLGISLALVYRMLQERKIPNIRAGKLYIVSRSAYENWLQTCGTVPQTEVVQ